MNQLPMDMKVRVVAALVESNAIRGTARLLGVHKDTVMKLGVDVGQGCARLHDRLMRDLEVPSIQFDEMWSFVHKKEKRLGEGDDPETSGDQWLYLALGDTSKLIICYLVGKRTVQSTEAFIRDLRSRILNRPSMCSDGMRAYIDAIDKAFGGDVDYTMLVKSIVAEKDPAKLSHGADPDKPFVEKRRIQGSPDIEHASTSFVERNNLNVRMTTRRFARRTSGHSKKIENHRAAAALFVMYYNFCRVHETLRTTPAMAQGVTDRVWSIAELIEAALAEGPAPAAPPITERDDGPPPMSRAGIGGKIYAYHSGRPTLKIIKGGLDAAS